MADLSAEQPEHLVLQAGDAAGQLLEAVERHLLGRGLPESSTRTRVVMFHATNAQMRSPYYGILTQGFPQLVRVNRDVLSLHTTEGWPADAPVLCRVKMINEFPLIPDLEQLEGLLARESIQA